MLLTTTDSIAGKKIVKHLGMVRGNTVRSRNIGRDILAILRNIVGGEITDYTKLLAEARDMGADAVVHVYFASSEIMNAASEILVYGTAVKLADDPPNAPPSP